MSPTELSQGLQGLANKSGRRGSGSSGSVMIVVSARRAQNFDNLVLRPREIGEAVENHEGRKGGGRKAEG